MWRSSGHPAPENPRFCLSWAVWTSRLAAVSYTHLDVYKRQGYYNLSASQAEALKMDERIAYQIQVKTGAVSDMDGFSVIPYYVSELSDEIRIAETKSGKLPERENEIAVQAAMLKKMGIPLQIGSQITLDFCDGNSETFTVTGILSGGETAKRFAVFFSKSYADSGSQLKDMPYEVYAKLCGAAAMGPEECKDCLVYTARCV